ncbi:MAG TPA: mechanosensitive ion channel family protein [Ignavibacteriales bacterium]|nr:mechanosensitive ion channel family protein [Ignavibacteriales bacterium]HOL81369.1 mechanosensitive ion channel family protein [Ignavibacteriales bacterium]HPD67729.1 mechanosensitive ion channel family protein [Ignavibacteriales bacterium]HPP33862.1 mechanosensitive ion channel family protein [Ignavibacteriales bacterium]HRT98314.1 mechanosensitive ion channel family protein [Ignavibacteriales bacterium]
MACPLNFIDNQYIRVIVILFIAYIVGLIFDKVIHRKIKKWVAKTSFKYDDIIVNSFDNISLYLFLLLGAFIGLQSINISSNIYNIVEKIILILLIFLIIIAGSRIAVGFIDNYTEKINQYLPKSSIFQNITKILIFSIGALIILQTLGISITPIITAMGVGGLAVALAFQETLTNLFAGLHILASRQIKIGDFIKLDNGIEGFVEDISWRYTIIKQMPNNMVIIPNSSLASAIVTNFNLPDKEMNFIVQVGVSYDSDLEFVEKVTLEVAKDVMKTFPGSVPEFEPLIRFHTFGDFSINFNVILRAKEYADQFPIRNEFIKRLHKKYKEVGITIPFPITTVELYKKN